MKDKISIMMKGPLSPDRNPAYGSWQALPFELWSSLNSPDEASCINGKQGFQDRDKRYLLPFLGNTFIIQPKTRQMSWKGIAREPTFQEGLVALTYLTNYKSIALSKKWVVPEELPGARTFFSHGSHPPKTDAILTCWASNHPKFMSVVKRLKGVPVFYGDEGIQIPSLPMVPIRYVFWKRDASFPPAVTLLVNATAHLFLPPDVLWALFNLTDHTFKEELESQPFPKNV